MVQKRPPTERRLEQLNVRVDPRLVVRLRRRAQESNITLAWQIELLLKAALGPDTSD